MKSSAERITELETQLAHLQRQYDVLNQVLIDQAGDLAALRKRLSSQERMLEELKRGAEPMGDPLDEKPPHY
ncbi:MAG: SlyX family protein [Planctomycetota bacterium]